MESLIGYSEILEGRTFSVTRVSDRAAAGFEPSFRLLEIRSDPALRIDLAIPKEWNGRLYMIGNGGYAGEEVDTPMRDFPRAVALSRGFAVVGTNTGHDATVDPLGTFAADQDKLVDYAYRAVHQAAVVAKTMLQRIYGKGPVFSYFEGCSTGGRQALMEAQRFPDDFDGIIAGAPVSDFTGSQLWGVRTAQMLDGKNIGAKEMALVADALRKKSAAANGLDDDIISDPFTLDFDVRRDVEGLGPEQAEALAQVYAPASIGSGRTFPGLPLGAEAVGNIMPDVPPSSGWAGWFYPSPHGFFASSPDAVRAVFGETFLRDMLGYSGTWRDFDFSPENMARVSEISALMDAVDPDLSRFAESGGKLLIYHGLADAALNAARTRLYFEDVQKTMGTAKVEEFARLYLVPAMFHCAGGYGPDQFDKLSILMDWVESGKAPSMIIASQFDPADARKLERTRPLFPYPAIAKYRGQGDPDLAESFTSSE